MAIPRAFASLSLALLLVASPLCCMADYILYSGETLRSGQALTYASYTFIMQTDCNLVLYDNGRALWASGTNGRGTNCRVTLQSDGNLVIYTSNNKAVWASNTNVGQNHYVLILQKDRNVVIYGGALWATNTNNIGVSGGMFIESKATIFGALPANKTTAEANAAGISMVVTK
ncbi:putative bulb-type lectin domain-containing protein [Dioscorea sansibarensis]